MLKFFLHALSGARNSDVRATALTLGATGLLLVLNLATGVVAARSLGPTGRGEMMALGLWSPFLATVTTLGLPSAVNYALKNSAFGAREIFGTAAALAFAAGTIAAMLAVGIIPFALGGRYPAGQVLFAQQCVLTLPPVLLMIVATASFQASTRFYAYNILRVLPTCATLIGLAGLSFSGLQTAERAVLAYVVPMAVAGPVAILIAASGTPVVSRRAASDLLKYGLRAYGAEVVGGIGGSIDRLLVVALLGPTEVGIFFVARNLADATMGLQFSLSAVLLPRAAAASREKAVQLAGLTARFGLMATSVAALILGTSAFTLIFNLYGPEFEPAAPLFRLLLVEVVLSGAAITLGQAYLALGRPGFFSVVQLLFSGLTAVILIFVLRAEGLEAAGVALIIIAALRLAAVWGGFSSTLREKLPRLLLSPRDVQFLLPLPYGRR